MKALELDFCVQADHPALPGHFPGRPVVPGVLILDHVLAAFQQTTGRRVSLLQQVKFKSTLFPGEHARTLCEVQDPRVSFRITTQRNDVSVLLATGILVLHPVDGATG